MEKWYSLPAGIYDTIFVGESENKDLRVIKGYYILIKQMKTEILKTISFGVPPFLYCLKLWHY